jgi:hypothetical protein
MRSQRGQIAALTSWVNTDNRAERTAPARRKFDERFDREVDPNNELTPAERAKRAETARKLYFAKLAFKSAKARRARAGGDAEVNGGGDHAA